MKGICKHCEHLRRLVAKGLCTTCYKFHRSEYPKFADGRHAGGPGDATTDAELDAMIAEQIATMPTSKSGPLPRKA